LKSKIVLTVFAAFILFMGAMTRVTLNIYENEKPLVVLGFAEAMELYNSRGDIYLFDNVLPSEVIIDGGERHGFPYRYIYIVREQEGLWGQNEFILVETMVFPVFHFELPYAVFFDDDFLNYPIVFGYEGIIYDGARVRFKQ
jgi:hypothetical protein